MKLLIIGSVGSGKSTLAKKMSRSLNIPHYEIDSIVHDDKKHQKRTIKEQVDLIQNINKEDSWIIEGTLRKNLDILLDISEQIILINIPSKKRKYYIIKRFIKQKLKIEKSNYKPTLKMLKMMFYWTKEFEEHKDELATKLAIYNNKLIYLNTPKEVNNYKIVTKG